MSKINRVNLIPVMSWNSGQFLRISVASNNLTRFEPSVFQPVLERMRNDSLNDDNRNQKVYLGSKLTILLDNLFVYVNIFLNPIKFQI